MSKRRQPSIPDDVRDQVRRQVEDFNRQFIKNPNCFYVVRFGRRYLFLDRYNFGVQGPICRLDYCGEMDNWDFAIYRYSKDRYDPGEWLFPGSEHIDGTVEGAMRAGMEAYPLSDYNNTSWLARVLSFLFGVRR